MNTTYFQSMKRMQKSWTNRAGEIHEGLCGMTVRMSKIMLPPTMPTQTSLFCWACALKIILDFLHLSSGRQGLHCHIVSSHSASRHRIGFKLNNRVKAEAEYICLRQLVSASTAPASETLSGRKARKGQRRPLNNHSVNGSTIQGEVVPSRYLIK